MSGARPAILKPEPPAIPTPTPAPLDVVLGRAHVAGFDVPSRGLTRRLINPRGPLPKP